MTKSEMAAKLNEAQAFLPGKRVKIDFGDEGVVMLDGNANAVTEEDGPADTTIKVAWADWQDMADGKLEKSRFNGEPAPAGAPAAAAKITECARVNKR